MFLTRFICVVAACFAAAPSSLFASSAYTCTAFGSELNGPTPTGVNNGGQITGSYLIPAADSTEGFLRESDGSIVTFQYPGAFATFPSAINNRGQIAGTYMKTGSAPPRIFLRQRDGSFVDIDVPPFGEGFSTIGGLNDLGEISGSYVSGNETYFFVVSANRAYRIVDSFTGPNAFAVSGGPINNSGELVENGNPFLGAIGFPRLLKRDGSYVSLIYPGGYGSPTPGRTPAATITGLNNEGDASGYVFVLPATSFVRMDKRRYPDVVCPDHADATYILVQGINDRGVLTGWLFLPDFSRLAFIATPTGVYPHAQVSTTEWSFGSQTVGQTSTTERIYLSNRGPADLHIGRVFIGAFGPEDTPSDFNVTATTCLTTVNSNLQGPSTLAPHEWCSVDFTFTPGAYGERQAAIVISDDTRGAPQIVRLFGSGQ